jgi:hypothetical protein
MVNLSLVPAILAICMCLSCPTINGVPRSKPVPDEDPVSDSDSFSRLCSNPRGSCEFENKVVRDTVYLSCSENRTCACDRYEYIADVPSWDIKWSPERKECRIGLSGPCGYSEGLRISCQEGLECLEGRCRDPSQLRKNPLNYYCNESIDCLEGLICRVTSFYFSATKTCVKPETKGLEGFEDY